MDFEEWWAKQTANFDPEEIGLMQLARVTWCAGQDAAREAACANIKQADDKASEGDYMLDSDDCISVIRGTWRGDN